MKPFSEPTYTQFSNAALDHVLPNVSPAVWKLISAILRKTKGWNKEWDELSYSQLVDMTGMTRPTVSKAITEAAKPGIILRRRKGNTYQYRLNPDYEIPDSKESLPVKKLNQIGKETLPESVKKLNSQKKVKKQKESSPPNGGDQKILSESQLMFGSLADVTRLDIELSRTKIAKFGSKFIKAGYTSDQVREHFGPGGWWYTSDWRGQNGEPPTLEIIHETIKRAVEESTPRKPADLPGKIKLPGGEVVEA